MAAPGRLALLALVLLGCAPRPERPARCEQAPSASFRIPDEDLDRDPRAVSGPAAALDLDDAVRVFAEAYAGVDGAPRLPSGAAITRVRRRLASSPRWEPVALAEELLALFRTPDGHLAFGWEGSSPLRLEAWPHGGAPPPEADGEPAVTLVPGAVPRLVVRTFDSAAAEALERLPAIARRLRELPAFVVDLRGNGGGNFGYAERFVLELTDATLRRLDEREVVSLAAFEGRANSARRRLAAGEVPPAAEPVFHAHIEALEARAAALRERGGAPRRLVTGGGVVRGRAPGPLRGEAVFLVDGGCASACEMAVALARQIPGVVVAGERTRGSMAAGEIALFRLPRSGVAVWLGTRGFRDPLGGFAETRGFAPEVPLAGGDAATETALALALALHRRAEAARVELPTPARVSWRR
jgi:Peptidase family S41